MKWSLLGSSAQVGINYRLASSGQLEWVHFLFWYSSVILQYFGLLSMKGDILFIPRIWFISPYFLALECVKSAMHAAKGFFCFSAFQHPNSTDNWCSLVRGLSTTKNLGDVLNDF